MVGPSCDVRMSESGWWLRVVVGPSFDVRMSEWVVVVAGGGGA